MTALEPLTVAIDLCHFDELPVGLGRGFVVGGRPVAVFRTRAGEVFAVENRCPHKGGRLSEGMLAGNQIVCPMHSFRFDPAAGGACDQESVCPVPTFAVELAGERVRIIVPVNGGAA